MAGKRLVMGPSPGTGLFAHEPRPREKGGRYAREPPKENALIEHEEERVNKQLVEILERGRKAAEAQVEDLKQRLEIREQEMAVLSAAKRDLEEASTNGPRNTGNSLTGFACAPPGMQPCADLVLRWKRNPQLLTVRLGKLSRKQVKGALDLLKSSRSLQLEPNVFHLTAAVSACEKSSRWSMALSLIVSLATWEVLPNEVTLSSSISACAGKGRWESALHLLEEMHRQHIRRDEFSGSAAITAFSQQGRWPRSLGLLRALHVIFVLPSQRSFACCSAVITACEKGRSWQMASLLFQASVSFDVIAYSAVISAGSKGDRWELVLRLLGGMLWAGVMPNEFTLNAVVSSCTKGRWPRALALPSWLPELPVDRVGYNAQIRICEEVQRWQLSFYFLGTMRHALRLQIDKLCWSCAMSACDSSGRWQAVLALMTEARKQRCLGDAVAYGIAIRACCTGWLWQQALKMLCFADVDLTGDMICCGAAATACVDALVVGRFLDLMGSMHAQSLSLCKAGCVKSQAALRERDGEMQRTGLDGFSAKDTGGSLETGAAWLHVSLVYGHLIAPRRLRRVATRWKAQILKLLGEVKKVEQSSASLSQELAASKAELARMKAGGQDVVRRYEEESGRRLELEERCLQLEEKVRAGKEKGRDAELQQKLKQCQQAKQTVEELAKQHEEQSRDASRRAEEAETYGRELQLEVQRLQTLCSEQKQRIRELEASPVERTEDDGMRSMNVRVCSRYVHACDNIGGSAKSSSSSKARRALPRRISQIAAAAADMRQRLDQLFSYTFKGAKHLPLVLDSRCGKGYLQMVTKALGLGEQQTIRPTSLQ
ncbi:Pentatricopeptide repeat-containing protein, chloroplastic [Symbiodinium microadriaticum]|uniref:Pentatricopeptide repeat-containing protein, chloroplastic n=2 Tax=Symbiodinium microadriaticum TaxID=2951 RepID=A0A1Q9E1Q1_SYMMI|nr:Pentatricopeptide repeat-containing protein, chloroplastic [Symbiodinium microadriaticum]